MDLHLKCIQFLTKELAAQREEFRLQLDTKAEYLLKDRGELFLAQYVRFEEGIMVLKFSNNRNTPRIGDYLYCFTLPSQLRDYRNWNNLTYGDLIRAKDNYSEVIASEHLYSENSQYSLLGFTGVAPELRGHIESTSGMILALGPKNPPIEYLENLIEISKDIGAEYDYLEHGTDGNPDIVLLSSKPFEKIQGQLALCDQLIVQGPPGTGKTHLIAEMAMHWCLEGKSVLVTALTNRALFEVAGKPSLESMLKDGLVWKTMLSEDEKTKLEDLKECKDIIPLAGNLILASFALASGAVLSISSQSFDVVIIDEASQAYLPMFYAAHRIGHKAIFIGDTQQLPPVTIISDDVVKRKDYGKIKNGLQTVVDASAWPVFQLIDSFRLTERAASFTGFFYNGTIRSKQKEKFRLQFDELGLPLKHLLHRKGGPVLLKTSLTQGELIPKIAIEIIAGLVKELFKINEPIHISVLSVFVQTTRAIQRTVYNSVRPGNRLLIETVGKNQGLTTDICIFFIPNTMYHRSLDPQIFNVATSRARRHTIILSDANILSYTGVSDEVGRYLRVLNDEAGVDLSHLESSPGY